MKTDERRFYNMKTLLGFTAGVLSGFMAGAFGMAVLSLVSDEVRDTINRQAEKLDVHW